MPNDTYSVIITEIREVVKQILGLRAKTFQVRKKIGKAQDAVLIDKIRKQIGIN